MIRKALLLPLLIALIISCDGESRGPNPFIEETIISEESDLPFLMITDVHINRKEYDDGITDTAAPFQEYLESHQNAYGAVLNLGDTEDRGSTDATELHQFLLFFRDNGIPLISAYGNHDAYNSSGIDAWKRLYSSYGLYGPVGCFVYGDIAFYFLDAINRTDLLWHLDCLDEALEDDTHPVRIIISHPNIDDGGSSTIRLSRCGWESREAREKLFSIMGKHGIHLFFSGHYHYGKEPKKIAEGIWEINLHCFHTREKEYGTDFGRFYSLELQDDSTLMMSEMIFTNEGIQKGETLLLYPCSPTQPSAVQVL